MRILLAEDDELLGSGIRAGLAQNGFQVDWVRDGVAAERELPGQRDALRGDPVGFGHLGDHRESLPHRDGAAARTTQGRPGKERHIVVCAPLQFRIGRVIEARRELVLDGG